MLFVRGSLGVFVDFELQRAWGVWFRAYRRLGFRVSALGLFRD